MFVYQTFNLTALLSLKNETGRQTEGRQMKTLMLSMVMQTFNPSTWDAEAGGFL